MPRGKKTVRHCDQRLTFVVSEQKTHDLGVCENSQDVQWQNLLRGRDREHATSPGLVVGRWSVGRSGHDEAGGWRWMQDKIYGICGYRPIESQGCEHFLSAKQLHTDHLGEFKKNAVQDAAPFKIIFPSTIHHSPLTSRC